MNEERDFERDFDVIYENSDEESEGLGLAAKVIIVGIGVLAAGIIGGLTINKNLKANKKERIERKIKKLEKERDELLKLEEANEESKEETKDNKKDTKKK